MRFRTVLLAAVVMLGVTARPAGSGGLMTSPGGTTAGGAVFDGLPGPTTPPRAILAVAQLAVITVAMTACGTASSYLTPSTSTTTLMAGWDRWFKLEWSVEREQGSTNRITGYITSQYGEGADAVRVLAQALDASGAVVGQQIAWVPGGVGGFSQRSFEAPRPPAATHYQGSVWDYSLRQAANRIP